MPELELVMCATRLKTYTGERLHVLQLQVRVEYSEKHLSHLVVAGNELFLAEGEKLVK